MKRTHLIALCTFTFQPLHSCQASDDYRDVLDGKRTLEIQVYYEKDGKLHTNYGAKIYVYYDFNNYVSPQRFTYTGNGIFVKSNQKITPVMTSVIDHRRCKKLLVESNEFVSYLIESDKLMKGRTWFMWPPDEENKPIKDTLIIREEGQPQ